MSIHTQVFVVQLFSTVPRVPGHSPERQAIVTFCDALVALSQHFALFVDPYRDEHRDP